MQRFRHDRRQGGNARPRFHAACQLLLLAILSPSAGGCEFPAQMVFSPDGSRAAWRCGENVWLIDADGNVLRPLGESIGGYAWSSDSKTLYFATITPGATPATPVHRGWLPAFVSDDPTTQPASNASPVTATVHRLSEADPAPLFSVAGEMVLHMQLSPDGQWLAVLSQARLQTRDRGFNLYVYSLRAHQLYVLASGSFGMAFTSANHLAFVEPVLAGPERDADAPPPKPLAPSLGRLIELELKDQPQRPAEKHLLDVLCDRTGWLYACANPGERADLLFTAAPATFPGPPHEWDDPPLKLLHFTRDGGVAAIAENVGALFAPSPDGKQILFESSGEDGSGSELWIMNANGSDPHLLRNLNDYNGLPPMWPAWLGNDRIVFVSPPDTGRQVTLDGRQRTVYEVVLYRLNEKRELEALQTLSNGWDDRMRPGQWTGPSTAWAPLLKSLTTKPLTTQPPRTESP